MASASSTVEIGAVGCQMPTVSQIVRDGMDLNELFVTGGFTMAAVDEAAISAAVDAREAAVSQLLSSKRVGDALAKALEDPPLLSKNPDVKALNAGVVLKVIAAVDDRKIDEVISLLDQDSCDILMKYIYKGLEGYDQSAALLKWHAKVQEKAGMGSIVRVMADRKTV
jgi:hypothetical protein